VLVCSAACVCRCGWRWKAEGRCRRQWMGCNTAGHVAALASPQTGRCTAGAACRRRNRQPFACNSCITCPRPLPTWPQAYIDRASALGGWSSNCVQVCCCGLGGCCCLPCCINLPPLLHAPAGAPSCPHSSSACVLYPDSIAPVFPPHAKSLSRCCGRRLTYLPHRQPFQCSHRGVAASSAAIVPPPYRR
jgi:hypothetical protein